MGLCYSIIHITIYDEEEDTRLELFHDIVESLTSVAVVTDYEEGDCDIAFNTYEYPPINFLEKLCKEQKIDIIGVYFDFESGLVGTIDLIWSESEILPTDDEDLLQEFVDLDIDDKELDKLK